MALLALYTAVGTDQTLAEFLNDMFADVQKTVVTASEEELTKCRHFMSLYRKGLKAEQEAAKALYEMYSPEIVVVTQGVKGGILYDGKTVTEYPSFPVAVVDSNGAGDVFHGAFAFALTQKYDPYHCCIFSSAVSALKCTQLGARDGVPSFTQTVEFLKERGFDEF